LSGAGPDIPLFERFLSVFEKMKEKAGKRAFFGL
jgi:hypothetical protein